MPKGLKANIHQDLLIWARQYAYLSIIEAAKRLNIPPEKLESWEKGNTFPTINQLHEVARVYHQPFAVFYLPYPPKPSKLQIQDYRRLPGDGLQSISPELANEIRIAENRREISIDLFQEIGEQIPEFSLTLNVNSQIEKSSNFIRQELGITIKNQKNWTNNRVAFNKWREALENFGVLVFQSSQFNPSEARGFSIGELPLPVITVNRKDTYTGRIFTLLHEFAHILLRATGVCELEPDNSLPAEQQLIEVFCNQIAAETIMPRSFFLKEYYTITQGNQQSNISDAAIELLASSFSISREAVVRRLLTLKLVTNKFYLEKRDEYLEQYQRIGKPKGFVPPATNVISLSGKPYTRLVLNAFDSNKITSSDVSNFLGVKIKHLQEIGKVVGVR